jgi:DNA replication and repair protein RecF
MRLANLSLENFRNFASLQIETPPGPTLLVGANAQGKTNLLEAIYYLVGASSPYVSSDRLLLHLAAAERDEVPVGRITAKIERAEEVLQIEIRLVLDSIAEDKRRLRKEILINGVKRRAMDLHGQFNAVLFLPQEVQVIEGSPGRRRRQLDTTLSQADPEYAQALSEYGKVLSQRNALLKQLQERRGNQSQLDFWDSKLADLAAILMIRRALALAELETLASPLLEELTRGAERMGLRYEPSFAHQGAWEVDEIRDRFVDQLQRTRGEEVRRGTTRIGPQRDDVSFLANDLELRLYGSRGQNRTAMLAYKLAEIEWLNQQRGEMPVLLLDEVLAELDPERRKDLQQRLLEAPQALLTAADLSMFDDGFRRRATLWRVASGSITKLANGQIKPNSAQNV